MRGITKVFPNGLMANDHVDLTVNQGEIHAVVGENGAGKSTLMNILFGLEDPDEGLIAIDGIQARITSPIVAADHGIGMVHQHFKLVGEFTVAENVTLGIEPKRGGLFYHRAKAERDVAQIIEENQFSITADQKISRLSIGQMQQVEIVKMLYRNAKLLILDEPTSVLTEQEVFHLFGTLKKLQAEGRTIILITHKLSEVKSISQRISVMRQGRIIAETETKNVDEFAISRLMVGERTKLDFDREKGFCSDPVLSLEEVTLLRKRQDRPLLDALSFGVSTCEIVGVTGVAGNGLAELEDIVSGMLPITSGRLLFHEEDVTDLSIQELRKMGFSYVPSDRLNRGADRKSTIQDNMIVTRHHDYLGSFGILDRKSIDAYVAELIASYSIKSSPDALMGSLSGGNMQKSILARELDQVTDFALFAEPTWGLDVASSDFIYRKILEAREQGTAVLLISSNLEEILAVADTIIVLYRGKIVMMRSSEEKSEVTREMIGEYMLGLRDDFPRTAGQENQE